MTSRELTGMDIAATRGVMKLIIASGTMILL